jgi:hypothetical protein
MIPAYITIPLSLLAAAAIAFGVLGVFALIDMFRINHRKDYD